MLCRPDVDDTISHFNGTIGITVAMSLRLVLALLVPVVTRAAALPAVHVAATNVAGLPEDRRFIDSAGRVSPRDAIGD